MCSNYRSNFPSATPPHTHNPNIYQKPIRRVRIVWSRNMSSEKKGIFYHFLPSGGCSRSSVSTSNPFFDLQAKVAQQWRGSSADDLLTATHYNITFLCSAAVEEPASASEAGSFSIFFVPMSLFTTLNALVHSLLPIGHIPWRRGEVAKLHQNRGKLEPFGFWDPHIVLYCETLSLRNFVCLWLQHWGVGFAPLRDADQVPS